MKKKELIKYIKSLRIESIKVSKPEPETIYMNEVSIGDRQPKFTEIHIIGYEN